MDELRQLAGAALGLGKQATDITMAEMALRAAVTFAVTLTIVRLGKKRLMSGDTAFDVDPVEYDERPTPASGSRTSLHRGLTVS